MKNKVLVVILIALMATSCAKRPCRVVSHYYVETANDGQVARNIYTTCELLNSQIRFIRYGDWGPSGSVFQTAIDWFGSPCY